MFPPSSLYVLRSGANTERKDWIRLFREVPNEATTDDPYDTREEVIYEGLCSVTETVAEIELARGGDATFEGDAMVRIPLTDAFDTEGVKATLEYGGIVKKERTERKASLEEVERGRVEIHLFINWTTHGHAVSGQC